MVWKNSYKEKENVGLALIVVASYPCTMDNVMVVAEIIQIEKVPHIKDYISLGNYLKT